jgi:hypothetical protein
MQILVLSIIIFILCYSSNFSFSVYYNTKILQESISRIKLRNTALKLLSFVVGLTCLSIASYLLPTILEGLKLKTPFELSNKVIASLFGSTSIFYAGRSLSKLKNILIKNTKK